MDLNAIPKIELHCHLDGILDCEMLKDILKENADFPVDPEQFAKSYPVNSIESFSRWFDFVRPFEHKLECFYPILERHFRRLKEQHVVYTEIMITGGQLPADPQAAIDSVARLREWVNRQESERFQVQFLLAVGRQKTAEKFAFLADRTIALFRAGLIAGFALAGPEQGNPVRPFASTMDRLKDAGLPIEIHAGEWCGPESVRDALQYGHPLRIGHAVTLFQDPELLEDVLRRGIHIEMCPTSNVLTNSVASIQEHPIRQAVEAGMSISINTDDPGAFQCSMTGEYEVLARTFGFEEETFRAIFEHSLKARFPQALR